MDNLVLFDSARMRAATLANQPIIWIGSDDFLLVSEVAIFLEIVHGVPSRISHAPEDGFWVTFQKPTALNLSSLAVATWLYEVNLGRAQL